MAKRLMVLVGMLAMLLTTAVPAAAQQGSEPVKLTGVVQSVLSSGGPPVFGITDEASGNRYILDRGEGANYSIYEGQRVSVEGIPRTDLDSGLNFLQVAVVRPLDGPVGNDTISVTFELDVNCTPPAGTTFFAGASQQAVGLDDPDGDGTYTGTLTLPEGFYDLGAFPVPVAILSGTPEDPQQTIEYFGEVVLEDGDGFSANVSFCDDSGSGNSGGSDSSSSSSSSSNGNTGSSGSSGSGSGSASSGSGGSGSGNSGGGPRAGGTKAKELPKTGGYALPTLSLVGTLLIGCGLVIRRTTR